MQNNQLVSELRQRALDSERLHRQLLRAREAERTRLARELHDDVVQGLVGLHYHLAHLQTRQGRDRDDQAVRLQNYARQLMVETRQLCADLRPPALDTLGLVGAIRSHLDTVEQTAAFRVRLLIEGDEEPRLPEDIALCLFRVVQEALSNVHKHAGAKRVEVRLALEPAAVWLTVEDDGRGFRVPRRLQRLLDDQHFGLVGLRERLELVDGTLDVVSMPGAGACLRAWVPRSEPAIESTREEGVHDNASISR